MTLTTTQQVDALKSEGKYFAAGRLARQSNHLRAYGCHFGMRSEVEHARAEFYRGFDAVELPVTKVVSWSPSPTSKAGCGFYPPVKFVGQVTLGGRVVAETGKCSTRDAAWERAAVLALKFTPRRQRDSLDDLNALFAS